MLEKINARVHTAEKGGKGFRVLGKGERIKFYFDGLKIGSRVFSTAGSVNILYREGSETSYWK